MLPAIGSTATPACSAQFRLISFVKAQSKLLRLTGCEQPYNARDTNTIRKRRRDCRSLSCGEVACLEYGLALCQAIAFRPLKINIPTSISIGASSAEKPAVIVVGAHKQVGEKLFAVYCWVPHNDSCLSTGLGHAPAGENVQFQNP
jgi:hypothetical protein